MDWTLTTPRLYVFLWLYAATDLRLVSAIVGILVATVAYTAVAGPVIIWLARKVSPDTTMPAR